MIEVIKKTLINIMVTTSAVIMFLPVVGVAVIAVAERKGILIILTAFINGDISGKISAGTIYEIFIVNSIIHFGFLLTRKFESSYVALEYLLDVGYTISVLVVFGLIFNWNSTIPLLFLAIMGVIVYSFNVLLGIIRFNKNAKELNELLQKRKERHSNNIA